MRTEAVNPPQPTRRASRSAAPALELSADELARVARELGLGCVDWYIYPAAPDEARNRGPDLPPSAKPLT
jgi:signal recognition particle subunit SEC65